LKTANDAGWAGDTIIYISIHHNVLLSVISFQRAVILRIVSAYQESRLIKNILDIVLSLTSFMLVIIEESEYKLLC